jgi:hypothetical protein
MDHNFGFHLISGKWNAKNKLLLNGMNPWIKPIKKLSLTNK